MIFLFTVKYSMHYILVFAGGGSIEFTVRECAEIYLDAWGGCLYAVDISGAISRSAEISA
jgi:hypothetical protein